ISNPLGADGPPIDSANDNDDRRFVNAGNQFISGASKNGLRLLWQSQSSLAEPLRIFIATFVQTTTIDDIAPLPENTTEATIGGETVELPFTLTDSAVQTTAPAQVQDASGTVIVMPAEQVINFPPGSSA